MTTSHWLRPHKFKSPDLTVDIAIVGGGYIGLATAYWLTELLPAAKIVILERSHVGAGASGRNAGFLTMGSATFYKGLQEHWGAARAKAINQFARESIALVQQHILKSSPEVKAEKTTSLTVFQTPQALSQWETRDFTPGDYGFHWMSEDQLASGLQGRYIGAFENGPEYKINPMQLLGSLRTLLESRKVHIIESSAAFEITPEGVSTELATVKCKQVVLALNGYLPQFHSAFASLIKPFRAQMLAVELEEDINSQSLHYDSPDRVYWRKSWDKILLIGGKRLLDEAGEVGDYEKVSAVIQKGLESYLREQLKLRYKVIHRWSGTMGFTDHELPLLSKVEAPTETFVIGGFSGHGMGLGFRSAQEMALLVSGNKSRSFFDDFQSVKISL